MALIGPELISQAQEQSVKQYRLLSTPPFEQGTCKKVMHLGSKLDNPSLNNVALAVTHETSGLSEMIIRNEYTQLNLLREKGISTVHLFGEVFPVTRDKQNVRYGMLMEYIPNATFIESKTPAPLKTFIYSCLLGHPVPYNETWYFQENEIIKNIQQSLPSNFSDLQHRADVLKNNFKKLLDTLEEQKLWIADLQILITQDGNLVIIDPLDIGHFKPNGTIESIIYPARELDIGFIPSLIDSFKWLNLAYNICDKIVTAKEPSTLLKEFDKKIPGTGSHYLPLSQRQSTTNIPEDKTTNFLSKSNHFTPGRK